MGQLTNLYVSSSYQGLLKMTDSSQGLTNTLQTIQTGDGDNSPLQMSLTEVNISGSFSINNVPITNGTNGTSGTSGTSGSDGTDGTSGSSGTDGTSGTSGSNGSDGTSGTSGTDGSTGSSGTDGTSGSSGTDGTSGSSGTDGSSGSDGTSGSSGSDGSSGTSGSNGTDGTSGTSGLTDKTGLITTGSIVDTQFISGTLVLTSSGSNSLEIKNTVTNKGFNFYSTQYAGGATFGGISSNVIDFTIGSNGNIVFNNVANGEGSGSYLFESNGGVSFTSSYVDIKSNTSITGSLRVTGSLIVTGSITGSNDIQINSITIGRGGGNGVTNTAVGAIALRSNVLGTSNIAIGSGSLTGLISGSNNIGIGIGTLQSLSGSAAQAQQNVIIGNSSGTGLINGERNTIIGHQAGTGNNINRNTGLGRGVLVGLGSTALTPIGSGSQYNVGIGHNAGFTFNSGSNNVFINGGTPGGEGLRSGSNNTVVGPTALPVEMNNSTIIGLISSAATIGTSPVTNSVVIADGQGNVMIRKDGSTGTVKFPTSVEITGSLNVSGNVMFASGSNKTMGTVALDGGNPGTATISNTLVTANSLIFLTKQTNNHPNAGPVVVSSKGSSTFTITSNHNSDTDTVAYQIINPA